jgi:Integrase core domain
VSYRADRAFVGIAGTLTAMQIQDVVTAPRSPGQNADVKPFNGSIGRECLDHAIVLTAAGLQHIANAYVAYYIRSRTHLSLEEGSPLPARPAADGRARRAAAAASQTRRSSVFS